MHCQGWQRAGCCAREHKTFARGTLVNGGDALETASAGMVCGTSRRSECRLRPSTEGLINRTFEPNLCARKVVELVRIRSQSCPSNSEVRVPSL